MNTRIGALKPFEEKKEYIESRISEGIEKNRKDTAHLRITYPNGMPARNVTVKICQRTHDFLYGANIFMLDELETKEKNELYKKYFKEAFNQATLPFYWCDLEPERGKPRYAKASPKIYRRPTPDLCLEFCADNHITPKEHCLYYDPFMPDWVSDDVESIKQALSCHFSELAERYGDKIHGWEVINETLTKHYKGGKTVFYDDPQVIEWCFKEAEKYFPENELIINEAHPFIWEWFDGNRSAYYMLIERSLSNGARIDAVGLQYHMFHALDRYVELSQIYYDPERIFAVLDRYSDFGKPIQITEVTIPAYSDSKEDEEIQSEILRNVYRIWFSHPNVEAITYWNLVDGYAAFAKQGDMTAGENIYYGGLIRHDFTPKPAYYTLKNLFHNEFRTETVLVTDNNGECSFRGFFGEYAICANDAETSIHLTKDGDKNFELTI